MRVCKPILDTQNKCVNLKTSTAWPTQTWGRGVFARKADLLTKKIVLRAKEHKFTLHEALIAESCGSDVECLIYSLQLPLCPWLSSGKLRGQRHCGKCVQICVLLDQNANCRESAEYKLGEWLSKSNRLKVESHFMEMWMLLLSLNACVGNY